MSNNRPNIIVKPSRSGDVFKTHSDSSDLGSFGFKTNTTLEEGVKNTYKWYKEIIEK